MRPGATDIEIRCDHACTPLDRAAIAAETKWGIDRLQGLVAPATAEKYGSAMAKLNAAIAAGDPVETAARAAVCIRGLAAMDAEATAAGHAPVPPLVWQYEYDGHRFGIIKDVRDWPPVAAACPGLTLYTLREVAIALAAGRNAVADVKAAFPGAQISAIRERTQLERDLEDDLPF